MFNLDPKLGEEAARLMESELNGGILEDVNTAYKAVETLGDNNITEQMKEKFVNLAAYYNGPYMEALAAVKKNLEDYTDFASFVDKIQSDTSVKGEEIDPVQDAGFGEAASML